MKIPLLVCTGPALILLGCGPLSDPTTYASATPSGSAQVIVREVASYWPPRTQVQIVIAQGGLQHRVFQTTGHEFLLCFAEVAWSDDEKRFLSVMKNCWGGQAQVAYDIQARKLVDPNTLHPRMEAVLRQHYPSIPAGVDPIAWVRSDDAQDAFFKIQRKH